MWIREIHKWLYIHTCRWCCITMQQAANGYCVVHFRGLIYFSTKASKEAIWLARLWSEFGLLEKAPMLGCDSQRVICLAKNAMFHTCTKHIDVRIDSAHLYVLCMCETQHSLPITLIKVHISHTPADVLTECLPKTQHQICIQMVGVTQLKGVIYTLSGKLFG